MRVDPRPQTRIICRRVRPFFLSCIYFLLFAHQLDAQFLTGYDFRKAIVLEGDEIAGTLTNFPVLISITDSDLQANALASGFDIVFTSDDGTTQLDHDLERYESGSGTLVAWVLVDQLDAGVDETLYMYFGNVSATNQSTDDTFSGVYDAVYHLNDFTDNAGGFDGSSSGLETPTTVTGLIGQAQDFDGSNDIINLGTTAIIDAQSSFSISAWVNAGSVPGIDAYYGIFSRSDRSVPFTGSISFSVGEFSPSNTKVNFARNLGGGWAEYGSAGDIGTGSWVHIAVAFDDITDEITLYLNGIADGSGTFTKPSVVAALAQQIGASYDNSLFFDGSIDELRVSNNFLSAEWIETEYNNQSDPSSFHTVFPSVALPVELISFEGTREENGVLLQWSTATEIENDYWTVERSLDGNQFEVITTLAGNGTTETRVDYEFVDTRPLAGHLYYRLQQTDFDGSFSYSPIVLVEDGVARSPQVSVSPNSNNGVDFQWQLLDMVPNSKVTLRLYGIDGTLVGTESLQLDGSGSYRHHGFDGISLPPGMYILKTANHRTQITTKMLVE
ncbi:MAG: DUF2341 domain-containing protein [Bacteroidota bacterium]